VRRWNRRGKSNLKTSETSLEERVNVLERELRKVKSELKASRQESQPWWERFAGTFKNDAFFDKVVKAGRAYRRSLAPRPRS
jgi:hypothetical protein